MEIDIIYQYIQGREDPRIVLLRNKEVIMWLFGDHSFLSPIQKKNKTADVKEYKKLEDEWGKAIMKARRPDLRLDGQWTNTFGEYICQELFLLYGKNVWKPTKMENYQPDIETEDAIIEAKVGTYYTTGTAGEKILGCPFKYAEIPTLYNKPLKIVCMGGAEKVSRTQYGNLPGPKCSDQKKRFLDFFKNNQIEYIAATTMLSNMVCNE